MEGEWRWGKKLRVNFDDTYETNFTQCRALSILASCVLLSPCEAPCSVCGGSCCCMLLRTAAARTVKSFDIKFVSMTSAKIRKMWPRLQKFSPSMIILPLSTNCTSLSWTLWENKQTQSIVLM